MAITWKSETKNISDLKPAKYNPRVKVEGEFAKQLTKSLDKFNLADPIILNADNTIIGGHQRYFILKDKQETVDVRIADRQLSEKEEKELNVRLNKNTGDWDYGLLADFDKDMLADIGFDSKELDDIFNVGDPDEKDDDVPEAPKEAVTKAGDVFMLGNHRIMCGDSTKVEDVEKLMNGQKSQMIHTDPPYNVDYGSSKNPRHKIRTIENDSMPTEDWEVFCKALFDMFIKFNEGDIYMWGASGPEGMRMRLWLVEAGCHWSATIVWKKQQLVLSPAKYQRMYEPCFYGWFGKSTFGADRKQTEVWDIDRPHHSKLHPTMKPIALCEKAIQNSSKWNDIVLDLFLGSGSTLIACEKTNRICYGMEFDPIYCDVIIKRWEDYTGKKAERL